MKEYFLNGNTWKTVQVILAILITSASIGAWVSNKSVQDKITRLQEDGSNLAHSNSKQTHNNRECIIILETKTDTLISETQIIKNDVKELLKRVH